MARAVIINVNGQDSNNGVADETAAAPGPWDPDDGMGGLNAHYFPAIYTEDFTPTGTTGFFIGHWPDGSGEIYSAIKVNRGLIGNWEITDVDLWNLASGTPTVNPVDGVILSAAQGQARLQIYEDANERVRVGWLSAGFFGIKVYDSGGSNVIFEASDFQQKMAAWDFDQTYLWSVVAGSPATADSSDGLVLEGGANARIRVYENTEKRTEMGFLSTGIYGFKGYAANGTTVIFEMSDTQTSIAGWSFTDTTISKSNVGLYTTTQSPVNQQVKIAGFNTAIYVGAKIRIDAATTNAAYIGVNATAYEGIGVWLGQTAAATYKFSIGAGTSGARLLWDNSALRVKYGATEVFTVTSSATTIGAWSLDNEAIFSGTKDFAAYTGSAGDMTIYSGGSIHAFNFYVDTSGDLHAKSGDIAGWLFDSTIFRSSAVGQTRMEMDKILQRISVMDSANAYVVSMGYLDALPHGTAHGMATSGTTRTLVDTTPDDVGHFPVDDAGAGMLVNLEINITAGAASGDTRTIESNTATTITVPAITPFSVAIDSTSVYNVSYTVADYGFWAKQGDFLRIDGKVQMSGGDWLIGHDSSYLVLDGSGNTIIRLGTDTGDKGLFLYDTAGVQLAKLISNEIFVGSATKFFKFNASSGEISWTGVNTSLTEAGAFTATSATITGIITATAGAIANWSIATDSLTSTNIGMHSAGYTEGAEILLGHATLYASAKIGLKADGSGKIASGNFSWDTAGNITGAGTWTNTATITGGIFQTNTSNPKVIIDGADNTLKLWDAVGNLILTIDDSSTWGAIKISKFDSAYGSFIQSNGGSVAGQTTGVAGQAFRLDSTAFHAYGISGFARQSGSSATGITYGLYGTAENQGVGDAVGVYGTATSVSGKAWAGYFDAGDVTIIAGDLYVGGVAAGNLVLTNAQVLQNITGNITMFDAGILSVARGGSGLGAVGIDRLLTGNGVGALTAESTLIYNADGLGIGQTPDAGRKLHAREAIAQLVARFETDGLANVVMELVADGDGTPKEARIGVDHSDDLLRINKGSSFDNTDNGIAIDNDGIVMKAKQPSFLAYNSATDANPLPTAGVFVKAEFDTERFDLNADYNNVTDTFTAPVTGKYQFSIMFRIENMDSASIYYQVRLNTSNATYTQTLDSDEFASDINFWTLSFAVLVDMDVNDTAIVDWRRGGGANVADAFGASTVDTSFSGFLAA